ncbi:single-stranded DNA-binding protein [Nocardia vinacea]|uniref:single-stranded DNA-binding protein n=1 Tax=Nocardia vinacea TaxID=96468 RepID=UPI0003108388|nr:single-stranded DNA-binding protein [Nocardia vinacea]
MAADTIITVIGNLVASPELKYTPAGTPVANFTVASTPRRFDRASARWKDSDPLFLPCHLWRDAAQNLAESNLPRGARVIVSGRLTQRTYQTREGHKRTVTELEVDEIGPSTRWATVAVSRTHRREGEDHDATTTASRASSDDPWASAAPRESAFAGTAAPGDPDF